MIWTQGLADAARELAIEPTPENKLWRKPSDDDVRLRALEYCGLSVGHVFQPFQLEYTECLLQRLDLDWDNPRDTHIAFRRAWEAAQ